MARRKSIKSTTNEELVEETLEEVEDASLLEQSLDQSDAALEVLKQASPAAVEPQQVSIQHSEEDFVKEVVQESVQESVEEVVQESVEVVIQEKEKHLSEVVKSVDCDLSVGDDITTKQGIKGTVVRIFGNIVSLKTNNKIINVKLKDVK